MFYTSKKVTIQVDTSQFRETMKFLNKAVALLIPTQSKSKPYFLITFFSNNQTITGIMEDMNLEVGQSANFKATPVSGSKKPVTNFQLGTLEYSTSNETVGKAVEDPADETMFRVDGLAAGDAQINFSVDADAGDGVETITGFFNLHVKEPTAKAIDVEQVGETFPTPEG